jgi:C-terminal processing protease CtpA/Prc
MWILWAALHGHVSNAPEVPGRIGIKIRDHVIVHVYAHSPAFLARLHEGDVIYKIDDKDILGPAGTYVTLEVHPVENLDQSLEVIVPRVPFNEVYD